MNIDDLKSQPRWVCYTAKKIPVDAKSGRNASSTDSSTWTTHDEAEKAVGKYNTVGVGFVLTGDGIVGIDLDACLTSMPDGSVKPSSVAKQALYFAKSYSEISPSGKGLHIIGTAEIPEGSRLKGRTAGGDKVEIYETARYFTFTENLTEGSSEELTDIQDAVDWLIEELKDAHQAEKPLPNVAPSNADYPDAWVKEVMQRRINAGIRMVANASEGDRHETRIRAGRLLGGYLAGAESIGFSQYSDDQITDMLYGAQIPRTGAQRQERKAIVDGIGYGRQAPLPIPRPTAKAVPIKTSSQDALTDSETNDVAIIDAPYHHTDVGNGKRLVDATKDKLRYVPEWKAWIVWNGQRWEHTDVHAVKRLAHAVVLEMYKEAGGSLAINADLAKWALKSESTSRIDGMIAEAQPYLVAKPAEFDSY